MVEIDAVHLLTLDSFFLGAIEAGEETQQHRRFPVIETERVSRPRLKFLAVPDAPLLAVPAQLRAFVRSVMHRHINGPSSLTSWNLTANNRVLASVRVITFAGGPQPEFGNLGHRFG